MDFMSKTAIKHPQNRGLPPKKNQNRYPLEQKETGTGPEEISPVNNRILGDTVLPSLLEQTFCKSIPISELPLTGLYQLTRPHNGPMRGDLSSCTRRKRSLCKAIDLPKIREPQPVHKESTVKRICQTINFSASWSSLNCAKEDFKNQHKGKIDSQVPTVFTTPFVHQNSHVYKATVSSCTGVPGITQKDTLKL